MARSGTCLVPTIATYELIAAQGRSLGVPESNVRKIEQALAGAYESLKIAQAAGVAIGSGSDLLGPQQPYKTRELALKAKVLGPLGALVSATRTNAEMLGLDDAIGTVEEGKLADLLLVDGDPLDDIALFEDPARVLLVLQAGAIVVDRR